ncbi:methyltransferase domain-containing protein [Heliobacterium gestii]|uniref:Methyltransferase domain-containing protein n=1 Tax=Heliomicrobium gestii TaxID=2699 RepID=A0A845LM67_HELGE|nr:methyltransferase domain-containing protein [Heliomicrobium gestii]MBM7868270.1 ubiquinone/menaquinone biosynthesis C-methylase UbiE [Heliomicrobium gestii]MZP44463.1 methyltransferase domain-containing protein [Heliomicrobium gestii]
MSKDDLRRWSYHVHGAHYQEHVSGELQEHAQSWLEFDTVGSWYHWRQFQCVEPLLQADPGARWLTVGDGRYGLDAHYLIGRGAKAVATDISGDLLQVGCQLGLIAEYQVENAEKMTFADDSFDYVLCKESYHHFPRPMLALYEMLRVARKAVILIEPLDPSIPGESLSGSRKLNENDSRFKKLLKRANQITKQERRQSNTFEIIGNYVYTLSAREMEKAAIGMGLPAMAAKPFNSCYVSGIEYEKKDDSSKLLRKIRGKNFLRDILSAYGLLNYQMVSMVIFKEAPDDKRMQELTTQGYQVKRLPQSPLLRITEALPKVTGKRVFIFGAGSFGKHIFRVLKILNIPVQAFIDNNPAKRGERLMGIPIEQPAALEPGDYIFIASSWGEAIRDQLINLGFEEDAFTLCQLWE